MRTIKEEEVDLSRYEDYTDAVRRLGQFLDREESTLLLAGVPSDHPLLEHAASRLGQQQEQDGRWPSEDGPARDVHTTLEAMRVLRFCSRF